MKLREALQMFLDGTAIGVMSEETTLFAKDLDNEALVLYPEPKATRREEITMNSDMWTWAREEMVGPTPRGARFFIEWPEE